MSGWGCRHQYGEQCLRMRKECKPGMPGCVLRGKVQFIGDVEREGAESGPKARRAQSTEQKRPETRAKARRAQSSERKRPETRAKARRAQSSERKR